MKFLGCLRLFSKEAFNMENVENKRQLRLLT